MAGEHDAAGADDILPDALLDKHLGEAGGSATGDDDAPVDPDLEEQDEDLDDDDDDTLDDEADDDEEEGDEELDEEGDEDLDDDSDDELEEDEEDEDEEDEEEEDEEDEEDEEEDVLERLTAKDHRRIEKSPLLRKAHKLMQAAFTKRMGEVGEQLRAVELREQRIGALESQITTPDGMAKYLAGLFEDRPEIVGMAFEAVVEGDSGFDFMVEVGLARPDDFQKAFERVEELRADDAEMARHERARKTASEAADVRRDRQRLRQQRFDEDFARVQRRMDRQMSKLEVRAKEDRVEITKAVTTAIRGKVREDGSIGLSDSEVRAIVKKVKKRQDALVERARQRLERDRVRSSRKATKRKAAKRGSRRRVAPRASRTGLPKPPKKWKPSGKGDPLDEYVDARLSA